ncbi:MAG: phosphatidylinositol-specific phospholipase C [Oscillospiraceae bacterium]|nr:phosphatidylinositol-specific phospholipase C [Oscillospiraceae bacterium]
MPLPISLACWQKELAGNRSVTALTLPGTHDSCARFFRPYSQCQTLTVCEQLQRGVRFLDIRCRHIGNTFTMHHGLVYLKMIFDDVLNTCEAFLHENPSEFVFLSVKDEHTPEGNTRGFEETLAEYIAKRQGLFYTERRFASVEDLRGKLVLFSRYAGNTMGLDATRWADMNSVTEQTEIVVQDNYMLKFPKTSKWEDVRALLLRAEQQPLDGRLYVNFVSGTGVMCPDMARVVAKRTNAALLAHITGQANKRYGIVVLDFPELPQNALLKKLIALNFEA